MQKPCRTAWTWLFRLRALQQRPKFSALRNIRMQRLILAQPRGFCAGVDRAIAIVERSLERFGAPVYVRHEIVHNQWVVDNLRAKGVVFVEDIAEVPDGEVVIFSAHGTSDAVESEARGRGLPVIDATCPLVTK